MELTSTVTRTSRPRVPGLIDAMTDRLLAGDLPFELAHAFGGPFHVLVPEAFDANVDAIRDLFAAHGVSGQLFYAKKANKAAEWMTRCAALSVGVDVASVGELREALGNGVPGRDLVVTGPAKSAELLRLALRQQAILTIDDPSELAQVQGLLRGDPSLPSARVLLRALPAAQPHSRFGMDGAAMISSLDAILDLDDRVRLAGFSVHLGGYSVDARIAAGRDLLGLCDLARRRGLRPEIIDLGGGLPVRYTDATSWQNFLADRRPDDFHAEHDFDSFYPYYSETTAADAVRLILDALGPDLRRAGLGLALEPGRALLDQAGFTVFGVQGVKPRADYDLLVVDGTSLSLSEQWFGSEFAPDPVLLPAASPRAPSLENRPASVGAATCLESDMLTWRKVDLGTRARVGDLLVYLNTAGYQMDSNESTFHELALPPKVVVDGWADDRQGVARPRWRLDRPR